MIGRSVRIGRSGGRRQRIGARHPAPTREMRPIPGIGFQGIVRGRAARARPGWGVRRIETVLRGRGADEAVRHAPKPMTGQPRRQGYWT